MTLAPRRALCRGATACALEATTCSSFARTEPRSLLTSAAVVVLMVLVVVVEAVEVGVAGRAGVGAVAGSL